MKCTTIGESCTLHARIGWQGLTKSEYLDEGDYYLVTGVDFEGGHIAFDSCHFVAKERYDQDPHIQVQQNDVLVTKDGTIGKVAFIDQPIDKPATLNSGVFVVRPKDTASLLPEYLMIVLMSNHFVRFIEQIKVGCTIAHLNQEKFINYQFPLPTLTEQKHIIEVYYAATKVISYRLCQLRTLDTLIKALFVEMFEGKYPSITLGNVVKTTSGGTPSKKRPEYYIGGTIPWLTSGEINAGVITSVKNFITDEGLKNSSAKMIPENSVVIAMYGATAGVTGILKLNTTTNQAVCSLLPNERFIPEYLYYAVSSKKDWMVSQCKGGGQPNISQEIIRNLELIDAPINAQRQFAAFVLQTEKTKAIVEKALDKAQELFDSLMQQYFG